MAEVVWKSDGTLNGFSDIVKRLNNEIQAIKGRSMKGLIRASVLVRRDMENTPPLIPLDTGNLRASYYTVTAFTVSQGGTPSFKGEDADRLAFEHQAEVFEAQGVVHSIDPIVVMGFSAHYAVAVHENMEAEFQRPGAGPKFFENALQRNTSEMLRIIQQEAQIK